MVEGQPIGTRRSSDKKPQLNRFLQVTTKTEASDVHLKVGQPPKLRIDGELRNTTGEAMTEQRIEELVFEILNTKQKEYFTNHGTIDLSYAIDENNRFRLNIFRQRGAVSLAARRINSQILPFKELNLPPVLEKICRSGQGLVLVVGPTGCGKTTTIVSMIDYINSLRPCHIITIEDPIEYLFTDKKAIVSQREIGIDVKDYEEALLYMVREDPDVVFIGEMRDAKTVTAAMRAAETGHLVFGTMHSSNATQSVQRLLDLFPQNERDLVRQNLSLSIKSIISQILLPSIKKEINRIPAVEILLANAIVKKLISEKREAELANVIRNSQNEGMQDLTENLRRLIQDGYVDPKDAYAYAPNLEELKMALKGIRTHSGGIL